MRAHRLCSGFARRTGDIHFAGKRLELHPLRRQRGYCASQYLSDSAPGAVVISDTPILDVTLEKVTGWTANIRQAETLYQWCSADAPETAKVEADLVLTVLEKGEIWCRVRTEEGRKAIV